MHDQIGIAADRRGEMGVATQIEAEMAQIIRAVFGLRLRTQDDFVNQFGKFPVLGPLEDAVELAGLHQPGLGHVDAERRQEFGEGLDLLFARRVVDAVEQRRFHRLQRFGGGDIGLDHEFFDQPVRVEPFGRDDARHAPEIVEDDLALGQVEFERPAFLARLMQCLISRPKRLEDRLQQRLGLFARTPVDGGLRFRIGELGGRAHHAAHEAVIELAAMRVENHPHCQTGPVDALLQRAQVGDSASGSIGTTWSGK